jgi:hypothetical protein
MRPDPRDLTCAIMLAFAAGFLSICATVTSAFDTARFEAAPGPRGDEPGAPEGEQTLG